MNIFQTEEKTKPKDTRDAVAKAAERFHVAPTNGEPDWQQMLLAAKDQPEKWRIRAAKEAYESDKKFQAHQKAMDDQQNKIAAYLATPTRNKAFYDKLQKEDPRAYWSTEIQKAKQNDRKIQGLHFHLK